MLNKKEIKKMLSTKINADLKDKVQRAIEVDRSRGFDVSMKMLIEEAFKRYLNTNKKSKARRAK